MGAEGQAFPSRDRAPQAEESQASGPWGAVLVTPAAMPPPGQEVGPREADALLMRVGAYSTAPRLGPQQVVLSSADSV